MYCVSCGMVIQDGAKFCSHCGYKQHGEVNLLKQVLNRLSALGRNDITSSKMDSFNRLVKKATGWYLAWILIHLGLLLIGGESVFANGSRNGYFWPIEGYVSDYDIREFIVFTVFPVAIAFIWNKIDHGYKNLQRCLGIGKS